MLKWRWQGLWNGLSLFCDGASLRLNDVGKESVILVSHLHKMFDWRQKPANYLFSSRLHYCCRFWFVFDVCSCCFRYDSASLSCPTGRPSVRLSRPCHFFHDDIVFTQILRLQVALFRLFHQYWPRVHHAFHRVRWIVELCFLLRRPKRVRVCVYKGCSVFMGVHKRNVRELFFFLIYIFLAIFYITNDVILVRFKFLESLRLIAEGRSSAKHLKSCNSFFRVFCIDCVF